MSTYRLKIASKGIAVNGVTTGATPILLTNTTPVTVAYDNIAMDMSLYGVSFHRKIYEPGHIRAEVLIKIALNADTTLTVDTFTSMFINRKAQLELDDDQHVVAKNYYIHEITPQFEKTDETKTITVVDDYGDSETIVLPIWAVYVRMDIFSMDKLLDLNRFSNAFLGKKLYEEIVKGSLMDYPLVLNLELNGAPAVEKSYIEADTNRLLTNLGYGDNKTELVQPYLVQYNETFYEFLRRVSNRCGEVFYFEEGKLCFGLSTKPSTVSEIEGAKRVMFQRICPNPQTVSDYFRDSEKEWDKNNSTYKPADDNVILADPVAKNSEGFPKEAFPEPNTDGFQYYYNSEIASEDHYVVLYKDRFAHDKDYNIFWPDTGAKLMEGLQEILNSKTLIDLLSKAAAKTITSGIMAGAKKNEKTEKGNKTIADNNKENPEGINKGGTDYTVLFAKVDSDKDHWITLNYYKDIKSIEEAQTKRMVCVDMEENTSGLKLGDYIKMPNDDKVYVVVRIDMNSANPWQRNYDGFLGEDTHLKNVVLTQSEKFYAIPLTASSKFYPPLLPGKPFLRSGPQPAFVTDNKDPLSHGRVRIKYPWQPSLSAQKTVVDNAKSAYDTAKAKSDESNDPDDLTATESCKSTYESAQLRYELMEAATPWIRMSTPMATPGGGMFFKPEVGDEVMVDFENGNIERPYVTGTLYSKNVPQPTQGDRVIVSPNGHTIKMSDPTNFTEFLAGMYPGLKFVTSFGVDLPKGLDGVGREVLGGIEMTDKWGFYKIKMSSHERNITISSPFGDVKMNAFTGITISAPNGNIKIEGKNVDIVAGNRVKITSGDNIKKGGFFSQNMTGPERASAIAEATAKALLQGFGADKFFDFSLIRSVLEVFLRPVDGTLDLKSNRFLLLQAGKSSATIPESNFKNYTKAVTHGSEGEALAFMFKEIGNMLNNYKTSYINLYNSVCTAVEAFGAAEIGVAAGAGVANPSVISAPADTKALLVAIFAEDCNAKLKTRRSDNFYKNKITCRADATDDQKVAVKRKVTTLLNAAMALKAHIQQLDHVFDKLDTNQAGRTRFSYLGAAGASIVAACSKAGPFVSDMNAVVPAAITAATNNVLADDIAEVNKYITNSAPGDVDAVFPAGGLADPDKYNETLLKLKRKAAYTLVEKLKGAHDTLVNLQFVVDTAGPAIPADPYDADGDWATYLTTFKLEDKPSATKSIGDAIMQGALKGVADTLLGGEDTSLWKMEGNIWSEDAKGEVLLSNSKDATYSLAKDKGALNCRRNLADDREEGGTVLAQGITARVKNNLNYT